MLRNIFLILIIFIVGCSNTPVRIETQDVKMATLYCPRPPNIVRPNLAIYDISDDDDIGTLSEKYKISIRQLLDYSTSLEKILETYKK